MESSETGADSKPLGTLWQAALHRVRRRAAVHAAVPLHLLFRRQISDAFGILMYHRVTPAEGSPRPTWNVTPERFRDQLAGLLRRGFRPVALREALEAREQGTHLPPQSFVVTFDDGYENNHRYAWPVLRELNVPATIFLATGSLDSEQPFPCDDWPLAGRSDVSPESWRPLTTSQCAAMFESGLIDLGSHTHTHADFRGQPDALRDDVARSVEVMRDRFGISSPSFAFPYGTRHLGFSGPLLAAAVAAVGLPCALTTESHTNRVEDDPFNWGRFLAEQSDTSTTLAAKLDGWYETVRGFRRRWPFATASRPPRGERA